MACIRIEQRVPRVLGAGSAFLQALAAVTARNANTLVVTPFDPSPSTAASITAALRLHFWVRAVNSGGDGQRTDFTCRTVADNLRELFERSETHVALALKGVRHFRLASGPTPLPTTGYQTRLLIAAAQLRYFRPHQ